MFGFSNKDFVSSTNGRIFNYTPIDVKLASADLRLKRNATEDGQKGIPDAESTEKDLRAIEIDDYLSSKISQAQDKFHQHLGKIEDERRSTLNEMSGAEQDIMSAYESAQVKLKIISERGEEETRSVHQKCIQVNEEYDGFKKKNKLVGPADFPEDRILNWLVLVIIAGIEVFANAVTLGDAHPRGPVGVALEIFMHAIANVGAAALLGFYVWRFFHPNASVEVKSIGFTLAIPIIAFLIFINFFLAHYRDAISSLFSDGRTIYSESELPVLGKVALETLLSSPFGMADFKSWLLLFIGILLAIAATIKAYKIDDPFPGYGNLQRKKDKLYRILQAVITKHNDNIIEVVKDATSEMYDLLDEIRDHQAEIDRGQEEARYFLENYANWLKTVPPVGKELYAFYRQVNTEARKEKVSPACFQHDYELPENSQLKALSIEKQSFQCPEVEERVKENIAALNKSLNNWIISQV